MFCSVCSCSCVWVRVCVSWHEYGHMRDRVSERQRQTKNVMKWVSVSLLTVCAKNNDGWCHCSVVVRCLLWHYVALDDSIAPYSVHRHHCIWMIYVMIHMWLVACWYNISNITHNCSWHSFSFMRNLVIRSSISFHSYVCCSVSSSRMLESAGSSFQICQSLFYCQILFWFCDTNNLCISPEKRTENLGFQSMGAELEWSIVFTACDSTVRISFGCTTIAFCLCQKGCQEIIGLFVGCVRVCVCMYWVVLSLVLRRLRIFTGLAWNALVVWLMCVAPMWMTFVASDLTVIVVKLSGRLDHPLTLMDHIYADGHAIDAVALQIRCRRPSKMNQNHPRIARNTYAETDLYELHSVYLYRSGLLIVMCAIDVSDVDFCFIFLKLMLFCGCRLCIVATERFSDYEELSLLVIQIKCD